MSNDGHADASNTPSTPMDSPVRLEIVETESPPEIQTKEKTLTVRNRHSYKRKTERQPPNAGRKPIRPIDRLKMRPWLIGLLDSETVIGVQWVDREQLVFQVSWRHAAQHGWSLEKDGDIFERWARHTGKYVDGDSPDPKRWKANFRCALHSLPDVQEVGGNRKGRNACRIYKFHNGAIPDKLKLKKRHSKQRAKEELEETEVEFDDEEAEEEEEEERSEEDSNSEVPAKVPRREDPLRNSLPFLIKYLKKQLPSGKSSGVVDVSQTSSSRSGVATSRGPGEPLDLTFRGSPSDSAGSTSPPQCLVADKSQGKSTGNLPLVVQQDAFSSVNGEMETGRTSRTLVVLKNPQSSAGGKLPKPSVLTQMVHANMIGQPQVAMPTSQAQSRPNMGGLEVLLQAAEQQMGPYLSLCEEVSNKEESGSMQLASSASGSLANGVGSAKAIPSSVLAVAKHSGVLSDGSTRHGHPVPPVGATVAITTSSAKVPKASVAIARHVSKTPSTPEASQFAPSPASESSQSSRRSSPGPIPHLPAFATDHVYTCSRPPMMNGSERSEDSSSSPQPATSVIKQEPEDPEYEASSRVVVYHQRTVKLEPTQVDRHVMSRSYMSESVTEDEGQDPAENSLSVDLGEREPGISCNGIKQEMETDVPLQSASLCPTPFEEDQAELLPQASLDSTTTAASSSNTGDSTAMCDLCMGPGAKTVCIRVPEGNHGMGSYYHRSFCGACSEKVVGPGGSESCCPQGWTNIVVPCARHDNPTDCSLDSCIRYSVVLHWTVVDEV